MGIPGLEKNYQYGLYGQDGKIPFGGLTVGQKFTPKITEQGGLNPIERIGTGELAPSIEGGAVGAIKGLEGPVGAEFDTMKKFGFNF